MCTTIRDFSHKLCLFFLFLFVCFVLFFLCLYVCTFRFLKMKSNPSFLLRTIARYRFYLIWFSRHMIQRHRRARKHQTKEVLVMLPVVLFVLFLLPFTFADQDNVLRFKSERNSKSGGELEDLLRAIMMRGSPGNRNFPASILKDLGLGHRKGKNLPKLKSFNFINCGGVENITNLTLTPDPLVFPGTIRFSVAGTLSENLDGNFTAVLNVTKKVGEISIVIPCIDNIGSCSYNDLCGLLEGIGPCPEELIKHGIPCKCPLKKGNYTLPSMSVEIDAAVIPTGNYEIEGQVFDAKSGKMKACLQISASIGY